jgi:hypothetical protein
VERLMKAVLGAAIGVVLLAVLLAGSAVDLGATLAPAATAVLVVACGLGLCARGGTCPRSRVRDAAALAVLVLARGPLCDVLFRAGLGTLGDTRADDVALLAAVVTLAPIGLLLGRLLRPALCGTLGALFLGTAAGLLLVRAGAGGWLPAWIGVPIAVAALWLLTRRSAASEAQAQGADAVGGAARTAGAEPPSAPRAAEAATWSAGAVALLLGAGVALVAIAFRRLVPAYVAPSAHPAGDVLLALLVPAAIVAWPAGVLASGGWTLRIVGALGGLLVAGAVWLTANNLGLYENSIAHVALTRQLHDYAARSGGLLHDWHAWLLSFAGVVAAAFGVACGACRGARAAGCALAGAGLAQLAEHVLLARGGGLAGTLAAGPVRAPVALLLAAAACAIFTVPLVLGGRRGWLALLLTLPLTVPLAAAPFLAWQLEEGAPWVNVNELRPLPGFDEVRRPGEYSVEGFERSLLADVTVFSTPGSDSHALEGREAWTTTLSPREPVFELSEEGEFRSVLLSGKDHGAHDSPAAGEEESAPPQEEEPLERHFGVRVAGRALHAQHVPIGAEGSVGRLTRLFAVPGRMLVCGVGAELVAADLHDAGLAGEMVVGSPAPLGTRALHVLLDHLGSAGWQAADVRDPQLIERVAAPESFDCVVVAPASEALPGTSALLTAESLGRLAATLKPGGRCLLWLDTAETGGRALRARVAAFGAVFGERSAAFVEPRELDAPFVLLVGWAGEGARPAASELLERLAGPSATGFRTRLTNLEELGALLLRDGQGLVRCASEWPIHARAHPVEGGWLAETGWAAVIEVLDPSAELGRVIPGAAAGARMSTAVHDGLAAHSRYRYRLLGLNDTLLEIKPDVNWQAFEEEAAHYARAADADARDPLLQLALAALLEQLAIVGEYSRFVRVYQECGAAGMSSWRLALQAAWVHKQGLDDEGFADAVEQARDARAR